MFIPSQSHHLTFSFQPFLPDLWESSKLNAETAPVDPLDVSSPSILAVAGDASHISGTSHTLEVPTPTPELSSETSRAETSIFQDIAEDMYLPTSFKLPAASEIPSDLIKVTGTSSTEEKTHSRILDRDEKNGVWVLVGLLAGSWLAAGFFKSPSAFAEQKIEEHVTSDKGGKPSH